MRWGVVLFVALALCYTGAGLLPGHTLGPLDLPSDYGAWKDDPAERVRVSNSLHSDVILQFVPWDAEARRLLGIGEVPWVNRWAADGAPLFANPQTALLSPFTWPRLQFELDGLAVSAFLRLLVAALAMAWLARELRVETPQAVVSGLVYAASGYLVVWLQWPIDNVAAPFPGLLAAALRLTRERSRTNLVLVVALAAVCSVGGHPETLFLGVVAGGVFLVWESHRTTGRLTPVLAPSLAALLGFLLASVQILPFLLLARDSFAAVSRPEMTHALRLWSIPSQILPGWLGSTLKNELDLTAVVGAENFHYRVGAYIGALVLLALIVAWRQLAPPLRHGLVVGLAALVLSWYLPGVWHVLRLLPLFRLTALEYLAFPFVLFASLAAGPALAILASRRRPRLGAALATLGLLAMAAGSLPSLDSARPRLHDAAQTGIDALREQGHLQQAPEVYAARLDPYLDAASTTALRRVAWPGLVALLAGLSMSFPLRRRGLILATLAMAELAGFGVGLAPAVATEDLPPAPQAVRTIQQLDPESRFLTAAPQSIFPANLGTIYGVRNATSYDVLRSKSRADLLSRGGFDPGGRTFRESLTADEVAHLGTLGVRFVLSRDAVPGARRVSTEPAPAVGVYEIPGAASAPVPVNQAPAGFRAGLAISCAAALLAFLWCWRVRPTQSAGPSDTTNGTSPTANQ